MENQKLSMDEIKKSAVDDLYKNLQSSEMGLTDTGAAERLAIYGRNELAEEKANPVLKKNLAITVYGFLLPAMGWPLALFVWGYALTAFVITDFIKVSLYKIMDHTDIHF